MRAVTTGFITRCCASVWISRLLLAWALACGLGAVARAEGAALSALSVAREGDELILSARLDFALSPVVEDALHKGIPVHFVAEAEVLRERWYWADRSVALARRYLRLSYQPLTRRWRLNTSSEPLTNAGLGVSLTQSFDTLDEALTAVQRVGRWRIASAADIDDGGRHLLRFRFRLDASQLPRTLQIGSVGHSDWVISVERRIDLTQELAQ